MDIGIVNKIKRLAIVALASDDDLIETIVLKGGNAIDIAYHHSTQSVSRTSFDLDFSIEDGDFKDDLESVKQRIHKTLVQTFSENGYVVIDYNFIHKPKTVKEPVADFWGGYLVTFKVVEQQVFEKANNFDLQRRLAVPLKPDRSTKFELEFSKFEYVADKTAIDVDGYTIYVYTPEMIVFEKVRAICQQLPQYAEVIKSHTPRARARDFYDIYLIMESCGVVVDAKDNIQLLQHIFDAKRVPVEFIQEIRNNKTIHFQNWDSVKDTVSQTEALREFDFYFNYVVEKFESITFP
ncbi:nucleotidyl transferase AbiEii/AbiGii toxin family protein [Pontibacter pudoricolor]|uniref:nucleotidyl transferase AbiEii/AbiGii toxin family protein n=1 Tax=Pontibacter pudoricolor TaxID=2694930 RepID=UPI0013919C1C|nr:nucleotidyl transferase AbiEii/AbiGii toxin family protein [Pontibacter pudoricolor]